MNYYKNLAIAKSMVKQMALKGEFMMEDITFQVSERTMISENTIKRYLERLLDRGVYVIDKRSHCIMMKPTSRQDTSFGVFDSEDEGKEDEDEDKEDEDTNKNEEEE